MRGRLPSGPAIGYQNVDMPIGGPPTPRDSAPATLCVSSAGVMALGGMGGGVYADQPQSAILVEGERMAGSYVGVWFLPDSSKHTSLIDLLPTLLDRASLFRPDGVARGSTT